MIYKLAIVLSVLAVSSANIHDRAYYEEVFFEWLKEHSIIAQSGGHFVKMLQNFADNHDIIETHNAGNHSYTLGHNKFSHMGRDEWKEYIGQGLRRPTASTKPLTVHQGPGTTTGLPTEVDWVSQGGVASVKDQGQCGSCWSFSATGALEGAHFVKTGSLVDLSPQHFVDCDNFQNRNNKGQDLGCNGGLMDSAFSWASKNNGLCEWNDYPYVSGTTKAKGTCSESCKKPEHSPIGYTDVKTNDEAALMSAVAGQPVAIAIEADQSTFQLYKSGVFSGACGAKLDHGVLVVGYGNDAATGEPYWKVKNSWGSGWGESGYIRLTRNEIKGQPEGQCGLYSGPPSYANF